ncbi:hypothetical protein AB5L52_00230 [Streptomyces sp. CG4]|uniref:hypothetical protein n=1 Tax=Streptomyces sp. CG4 TaxID=408783 RepID=UPI0034E1B452
MRFRTVLAVTAVTAALGTVSACGGKSASAMGQHASATPSAVAVSPVAYLVKVENATAKIHSFEVDRTLTMGTLNRMRIVGDEDWANGLQANLTMSVKTSAPTSAPALQTKIRSDAVYLKVPAQKVATMRGKHWIKEPLALIASQGAAGKASTDQLKQVNPALAARMLIASGNLRKVGQETVRGTNATHFTGTLDTTKLIASRQGLTLDDVKFLKKQLAAQGVAEAHIDLWVNGENLPVEAQEQMETNAAKLTSTAYFSHYGLVVNLSVPDASDTYTLHSLPGDGQAGAA